MVKWLYFGDSLMASPYSFSLVTCIGDGLPRLVSSCGVDTRQPFAFDSATQGEAPSGDKVGDREEDVGLIGTSGRVATRGASPERARMFLM
jgi:hypothetical protein